MGEFVSGRLYRVGIHAADALADEGSAWLRSDAGIAYRRHPAEPAYDSLPATIWVSRWAS